MLPALPSEALLSIVEKLWNDKNTVRNISLTSRQFYQVAEPVLFGHAIFLPFQVDALESFLKTIKSSNGRRGAFVKFLTFVIDGYGAYGRRELRLIDQILMQTPNLNTLYFRRYSPIDDPPLEVLRNAPFTLKELNLLDSIFDQHLADFLEMQPKLETLGIPGEEDIHVTFPSVAFPNLTAFTFANLNVF